MNRPDIPAEIRGPRRLSERPLTYGGELAAIVQQWMRGTRHGQDCSGCNGMGMARAVIGKLSRDLAEARAENERLRAEVRRLRGAS